MKPKQSSSDNSCAIETMHTESIQCILQNYNATYEDESSNDSGVNLTREQVFKLKKKIWMMSELHTLLNVQNE